MRISEDAYSKIDQIAKNTGLSRQDIIDQAIGKLEQEIILQQANEAYSAVKRNPEQSREQQEINLWESTLQDRLGNE